MVARKPVQWGDWSIVEATITMLRFAVDELNAEWCVLISGEHRPLTDLAQWEESVTASGFDAFVESRPLPRRLQFGVSMDDDTVFLARCVHQWSVWGAPRHRAVQRALGSLLKVSRYMRPLVSMEYSHRRASWFVGRRRSTRPVQGWTLHKGSQWVALNRKATDFTLGTDPNVTDWFRSSYIPDETYLHTLLNNALVLNICNVGITYIGADPQAPLPMVLSNDDLEKAWKSGAPFARKVSRLTSPDIVQAIDAAVERQRARVS
jgi:hypothetical protein